MDIINENKKEKQNPDYWLAEGTLTESWNKTQKSMLGEPRPR